MYKRQVYSLEIIIPVAFRLNTYYTHVFRMWLVEKALSKEKRQAYVMFIQNGNCLLYTSPGRNRPDGKAFPYSAPAITNPTTDYSD